ncbi:MAG: WYL domain-containing protein [Gemmatimonadota bacterium]
MRQPANTATADAIFQRLLLLLPTAHKEGTEGVELEALASGLGVEPRRLLRDLEEVQGRTYYLPPGLGDQIQLRVTRDRVGVWTSGEFQRPLRLTPREALALELALRVVTHGAANEPSPADDGPPSQRQAMRSLGERLAEALRAPPQEGHGDPAVALGSLEVEWDQIRREVDRAVRDHRTLRIRYAGPGSTPRNRKVGPILLAHAQGHWYLVARDLDLHHGEHPYRAFRLDRVLEARMGSAEFHPSQDDRGAAAGFLRDGRIHDGGTRDGKSAEATVVYSQRIAPWILEQGWSQAQTRPDGSVEIRHTVSDLEWLIRHVLTYGGEAVVEKPVWIRDRVVKRVDALG